MTRTLFICPACKQKRGVNISFGYPSFDLIEQVERNEAVLGGCCPPSPGDPERQCLDCGHQWEIVRRRSLLTEWDRQAFEDRPCVGLPGADNLTDSPSQDQAAVLGPRRQRRFA
jgi:hypothetical protein